MTLLTHLSAVDVSAEDVAWREKYDLTLPVCGPWLLNPSETTMSVNWITCQRTGAGIEYREKGTKDWIRRWKTLYGKMDYTGDVQTFHLFGLTPGTDYEYRLLSQSSQYDTHATGTYVGKEIYRFRTMDAGRDSYSVILTSDVHGDFRDVCQRLYDHLEGKDCDFFAFLGDQVYDNMNQPRHYVTDGYLNDVSRLWGSERPTVFVRGNHDCWGRHAAEGWATYMARPDGRAYFAFAHGSVCYVVLDLVEEYFKGRSPATDEVTNAYLEEEYAWFRTLPSTAMWQKAVFRVVLCHFPTRLAPSPNQRTYRAIGSLFNGPNGIHLYLCGDEHYQARSLPKTAGFYHNPRNDKRDARCPTYGLCDGKADFTEVCVDRLGALRLEVSREKLVVRVCDYLTAPGLPDLDRIEIRPDKTAVAFEGKEKLPWCAKRSLAGLVE